METRWQVASLVSCVSGGSVETAGTLSTNKTMKYEIERDIPIPSATKDTPLAGLTETIRNMSIGQSVFVPVPLTAFSGYYSIAKRMGMKITARKQEKDGVSGYRIWRTE